MRFRIRRDRLMRPLLLLIGASETGSFVDVERDAVHVRFGPLFDERLPRAEIASAGRTSWQLLDGVGLHGHGGRVVANGSVRGLVELRLHPPRRVRLVLIPVTCRSLVVSLEDPDGLLAQLCAAPDGG